MILLQNQYILFTLGAIALFTAYITLAAFLRRNPMRERIRQAVTIGLPGADFVPSPEGQAWLAQWCGKMLTLLGVDIAAARQALYLPLWRAGFTSQDSATYYLFFQRIVQPFLLLAAFAMLWTLPHNAQGEASLTSKIIWIVILAALSAGGLLGARLYLQSCTLARQAVLQRSFPDMLDLLLICVEAGLSLDAALVRVCRELRQTSPEISAEMDLTRVELNVRGERAEALKHLADRTDTQGFRVFTTSLIQSEQFGTSIADTLRALAEEYRITRVLQLETKARRIPALITLPMILFFVSPIFIVILGPPILRMHMAGGILSAISGTH